MKKQIYYTRPSITELEINAVSDAIKNGWGPRCYESIERFEQMFCEYTGAKYAIATSSCTGALHMGLSALDISAGDEVILADTNWVATAAPITYLGAKPVFIDILADSWCIDYRKIESAITARTKAIIAVHLYGNLCHMNEIMNIGKRYNIPVIEDSAEALGSFYKGQHTGTIGKFGTFSFHGTKTMTTGEGGMFITNDEHLYEKVLMLSNHGRSKTQARQFWADAIGFKYKMSNIQAALGCAQLERIDELLHSKRKIFKYYRNNIKDIKQVSMNPENLNDINSYWMPTVVFDKTSGITRQLLLEAFSKANIDARVFFWPLSSMNLFGDIKNNPVSYDLPGRAINLPSYYDLTEDDQVRVVKVLRNILRLMK